MVVIMVMSVFAKLALVTKELLVARTFGTADVVDAFLIAFLLPMFAINVLAGSFSAAMMPTYIRVRDDAGEISAQRLFSSVMLLALFLLILSALALAFLAPLLLPLLGSGFSEQTMALTQSLYYALLPVLVFTGIGHLYSVAINAGERFAVVALAPVITPVFAVIFLLLLANKWGIYALVAGTLLGAMVELAIIARAATLQGVHLLPRWTGMTEEVRSVLDQYTPMIAGAFLMSSTVLVDQTMAAMLVPGRGATLNYANKVVALFLGVSTMALGTAVLPNFSRMVAADDWVGIRHTFGVYSRLILFLSIPLTIGLFLFSETITGLLFERGAFSADDTQLVGQAQAFYALQIPFYVLAILGVRLISAMGRNDILMKISFVNLVINIAGNYIFMQYFGVAGIALSTSLVYLLSTGMIYLYLYAKDLK